MACGPRYLVDDGIQLFAGVMLLTQAAALSARRSQRGRRDDRTDGDLAFPPMVYDVLNDVHRACCLTRRCGTAASLTGVNWE